ncbi:hypothetical protein HID58_085302 [Brassica napus]|uniref:Uncharacterized protein n=1 Tax=Brassica napus TaxID=3708 RepID=A0ABQ7XM78_BRANA|nr:hypothetical protein HID58_085302 [Brassica napus]
MGSRDDSEEQFTLNTNYSPPATCDLETQQLMARLAAEEEIGDLRIDGANDGKKQARKRKLISVVDSKEESNVEITPPTRSSKPRRQTTYGTATRKPILQSTLDGGSGSSARACSQKNVPLKAVIRGGRRKASTQALSSEARKKKGSSSRSQKNKKKIEEEIPDFDDDLEEVELDEAEIDLEDMENRQRMSMRGILTRMEQVG